MVTQRKKDIKSATKDKKSARKDRFLIAMTYRSGSTLFCGYLSALGLGNPTESFQSRLYKNPASVPNADYETLPNAELLLEAVFNPRDSRWAGCKIAWEHIQILRNALAAFGNYSPWFAGKKWIYLTRRDVISQAVSFYLSETSQIWDSHQTQYETPSAGYSFSEIFDIFVKLSSEEALWESFFEDLGIVPLRLFYEDISAAPEESLKQACRFLGHDADRDSLRRAIAAEPRKKTGGQVNQDYARRFREEMSTRDGERAIASLRNSIAVLKAERNARRSSNMDDFIGGRLGEGFQATAIDLKSPARQDGAVEHFELEHFIDGRALRLNGLASVEFMLSGDAVAIHFFKHEWSGIAEIEIDGDVETLDLYAPLPMHTVYLKKFDQVRRFTVSIRAVGKKSASALDAEVWVERVIAFGPVKVVTRVSS